MRILIQARKFKNASCSSVQVFEAFQPFDAFSLFNLFMGVQSVQYVQPRSWDWRIFASFA